MKKHKVAFQIGAVMLALIGIAAGSAYVEAKQKHDAPPMDEPPMDGGDCGKSEAPPVCQKPECPAEGCFPDIRPGKCWSLCIHPGAFQTIHHKVDIGNTCSTPHVTQDGTKTVTVDKFIQEKCYGLRKPVHCAPKRVGWTYKLVKPERKGKITYRTCTEQEVGPDYRPITKSFQVGYKKPFGLCGHMEQTREKVRVKSEWEHLYLKRGSCPDCSDVCSEQEKPEYDWIYGRTCRGQDQECAFDYKHQQATCSYEIKKCVPPHLPPQCSCELQEVEVTLPPVYKKVPVVVDVCTPGKVQRIPVPGETGPVSCEVPEFKKECTPGHPLSKCVAEKVQVCKPFLEWKKEKFCNYDDKGHFIRKVQHALVKEGFDPGPIDGTLGGKTRQAIRDFQQLKGLAQGGKLTEETVQALGVQE